MIVNNATHKQKGKLSVSKPIATRLFKNELICNNGNWEPKFRVQIYDKKPLHGVLRRGENEDKQASEYWAKQAREHRSRKQKKL